MAVARRNNSVEFFRFIFMVVICMWHFNMLHIFNHGYLAVDFFFILSGYFLYDSYCRESAQTVITFLKNKIRRFFPEFFVMLLITFLMKSPNHISQLNTFEQNLRWIISLIPDSLFVFSTGVFQQGIINPTWYLSVLIFGGGWIYAMLKYDRKLCLSIIFPILIISFFSYINAHGNNLEMWRTKDLKVFLPLLRGMSEMCIGIYLYVFVSEQKKILEEDKRNCMWLNLFSVLSLFLFIILLFVTTNLDMYSIIFIPFIIIGCIIKNGWFNLLFNKRIYGFLGGITYEMLIVHWSILMVFRLFINTFLIKEVYLLIILEILYLFVVILCSYALKQIYIYKLRFLF